VTAGSKKIVWWIYPYDDSETGKHFDFEWDATPKNRAYHNSGCPYLTNTAVWKGYNDLQTTPPDLAKEWHPTKNGDLTPDNVAAGSHLKAWWLCPICGNEWECRIDTRHYNKKKCPNCGKGI
jgi:predicted RNA-binding Zn-ribbon protein involved in translation (DUF1610 family)